MEPPQNFFPSKNEFLRLIVVIAVASAVAVVCNFLATSLINPRQKPYCDSNVDGPDVSSDFCEPCPNNGECYDGKLECIPGHRKHGKLCVEDGDIYETAKKISERVENQLCEAYARYLCYGTGIIWVREDELWSDLDGSELMKNVVSDNVLYDYTKQRAMDTIGSVFETKTNAHGINELKCPDLLAEHYKPFSCRSYQWISEHALVIFPFCALLVGCTVFLWKVRQEQHISARVEDLYHQVCEILEENALTSRSVNGEPWVVASRLRDHLLLPRERKDPSLWKKVEELVKEDSRVDRYPKLVKGESKVVWEWQVEGSLNASRIKRKREVRKIPIEGMSNNSDKLQHNLKAEPKELIF
ncbi:Inner nuclear membrane Man1 [Quillaja saponaria]|uniref:Inner nuclear membrane Man1 n=1 Tax=Quillaja saponaria TaxID=32244 RepID=A0AAD7P719_QUISA|nr:Inner nuclear membrane Man1 [Quillaja saponaria]